MQSELVQEFVELVRCNDVLQALQYAQKNLAPHAATYMAELQQATAILAFRAETTCQPYARLFEGARWKDLLNLFLQDLFRLHSLPARSLFEVHLQVRKQLGKILHLLHTAVHHSKTIPAACLLSLCKAAFAHVVTAFNELPSQACTALYLAASHPRCWEIQVLCTSAGRVVGIEDSAELPL